MDTLAPVKAATSPRLMHLLALDEKDKRHELVAELLHLMGFEWLAYGPVRQGAGGIEMLDPWSSIGAGGWQRRYRDCGYQRIDPRLASALESRMPLVWQFDQLHRSASASCRPFINALGDTGMRAGVMLALAGNHADERTVVSLLTRDADPQLADDDARIGQVVTLGLCLREMQAQGLEGNVHAHADGRAGAGGGAGTGVGGTLQPPNPTQQAILQYLACGLCDKQIAARLAVSLHTVDYHMRQLRKRFGARNRVQLVQAAASPPTPEWRVSGHSDLE